jgi:hypothetical protein
MTEAMTPVPREVTAVAGCDCGGLQWHGTGCSIWKLSEPAARAALDAAEDRLSAYMAKLNASLRKDAP